MFLYYFFNTAKIKRGCAIYGHRMKKFFMIKIVPTSSKKHLKAVFLSSQNHHSSDGILEDKNNSR